MRTKITPCYTAVIASSNDVSVIRCRTLCSCKDAILKLPLDTRRYNYDSFINICRFDRDNKLVSTTRVHFSRTGAVHFGRSIKK